MKISCGRRFSVPERREEFTIVIMNDVFEVKERGGNLNLDPTFAQISDQKRNPLILSRQKFTALNFKKKVNQEIF